MEDAYCGSGPCFLTWCEAIEIDLSHAIECSKRSVHDFLLYQTVTGSIEHLWALAFRNQVRESVTNSLRKHSHFHLLR